MAIAILSAYAALDLAGRIASARGNARLSWASGGAFAMGMGIWSMHYIGMLALRLPIPVQYGWPTVLRSLLLAVFASGIALFLVSRERLGLARAAVGSLFMGGVSGESGESRQADCGAAEIPAGGDWRGLVRLEENASIAPGRSRAALC